MRAFARLLTALAGLALFALLAGAAGIYYLVFIWGADLPDYRQLANYEPPPLTRVHAGDGRLLAEYARERRIFVPIEAIPERVSHAFVAAEDQNFYRHPGIDLQGIGRAMVTNLQRLGGDRRPEGASTITQQVAKNFLLGNELSYQRKLKEMLLALRIERAFSKDRILELYLNEIFLGNRSYGVASAALNYFDKSLDELTVAEAALLAGLPKAPSTYDPVNHPEAALQRRNYVIGRMLEDGYITPEEAAAARAEPIALHPRSAIQTAEADFFIEEVRRQLVARLGEDGFYGGGLSVPVIDDSRWSVNPVRVLPWAICATGLERKIAPAWVSEVILAGIQPHSMLGTLQQQAEAIRDDSESRFYSGEKTKLTTSSSRSLTVDGLPAWEIKFQVRISYLDNIPGDNVEVLVVQHTDGSRSGLLTFATIGDTETQRQVDGSRAGVRVEKR